jgi:hypothetical protein
MPVSHDQRMVEFRFGRCGKDHSVVLNRVLTHGSRCCRKCSYKVRDLAKRALRPTFTPLYRFPGTEWVYLRDLPDGSYFSPTSKRFFPHRLVECRCAGCRKKYPVRVRTSGAIEGSKRCRVCTRAFGLADYEGSFNNAHRGAKKRKLPFAITFAWYLQFIEDNPFCSNPKCLRPLIWAII